jgi:hypothetical protein
MLNYTRAGQVAALMAVAALAGCLPTADPAKVAPPAPAPVPQAAIPAPPAPAAATPIPADATKMTDAKAKQLPPPTVSTVPAPEGGKPGAKMNMALQNEASAGAGNATIRAEPQADGSVVVNGGQGLNGKITPEAAGGWTFEGTIKFPAKGYTPGEPFVTSLDIMKGAALQGASDMTTLTIPFKYPPKGAAPQPGEETFPLKLKFDAPKKTTFVVMLLPSQ